MEPNYRPSFILSPIPTPKLKNQFCFPPTKIPTSTAQFDSILLMYIFLIRGKDIH